MIINREETKLSFFKELYEEARTHAEELYEKLDRHLEQYKGSTKIDGSDVEATQVRNITYELVESQVTSYLPNPSVTPKMYSERNERNAKSIEYLLKNKRNELPFEKLNDLDERYNPIYGGSVWLIEWDNSILTHNTVGDVRVSCLRPKRFTGQPNIFEVKDMEYCFIEFETTKDEIVRKYGVSVEIAEETESDRNTETADDNTATLYVCYYKNEEDKVCQYIWSGDTELLDLEDYYARKTKVCKKCGKREELCTCKKPDLETLNEEEEVLTDDVHLSDGSVLPATSPVIKDGQFVMTTEKQPTYLEDGQMLMDDFGLPFMQDVQVPKKEQTRLPFYTPNILPVVIRKNTSEEDNLLGQSDCEFIRPQQQAINKIESRIVEKLIGSGVYPIVPDDFSGDLDNSLFKKVFRAKQSNYQMFGRVDLQVDISRDIAQSDRLYDQAKRMLGITDSYQGQHDSSAQSGKAKQLQIAQAAGRLDSKRQMKNAAYAEIDQIIFQYYLAYADEPRPATYIDAQGKRQNYTFNRYDFIERDEAGEYYYNDEYLFATDSTIDIEKSRETLWQENRANFQSGAYGNPQLPQTLLIFWQNMEQAHYPWAHENVERIKQEIERQNEMALMQQQVDSKNQEIESRKGYEAFLQEKLNGGNKV